MEAAPVSMSSEPTNGELVVRCAATPNFSKVCVVRARACERASMCYCLNLV